jgi:hypothetical protein
MTKLYKIFGGRFEQGTYSLMEKAAEAQGMGCAAFVRHAVKRELARLGLLSDEEKKLLEASINA